VRAWRKAEAQVRWRVWHEKSQQLHLTVLYMRGYQGREPEAGGLRGVVAGGGRATGEGAWSDFSMSRAGEEETGRGIGAGSQCEPRSDCGKKIEWAGRSGRLVIDRSAA